MWTMSDEATAQLAGSRTVSTKVEVWNGSTRLVVDPSQSGETAYRLPVLGGQVVEDETAKVRRTLQLTVATDLVSLNLTPVEATDLLHPASGNELYVYRGILLPSTGAFEWAPMGVFRMTKPKAANAPGNQTITINGNDRSSEISRRRWTAAFAGAVGLPVDQAIQAILNDRWGSTVPALTYNMTPCSVVVPTGTILGVGYGAQGWQNNGSSTANDPWADCVSLAASAGCELFFDRQGVVVLRPVPLVSTVPVTGSFAEGPDCTLMTTERTADTEVMVNTVIVVGLGATVTQADGTVAPGAPVVGIAQDTNPNSPTYVSGPLGEVPADPIVDEVIATTADANNAAAALLPLMQAALDDTSFTAVDDPTFDAGDARQLTLAEARLNAVYIASSITHPLDASSLMQVTNRAASVAIQ